jgi:hypothetical protein
MCRIRERRNNAHTPGASTFPRLDRGGGRARQDKAGQDKAGQDKAGQDKAGQGRAGKRLGETIGEIVFPRNIVLCSPSTPVTAETETRQLASSRGAKKKRHENYAATQAEVVIFTDMDMDTVWMYEVALVEGATVSVLHKIWEASRGFLTGRKSTGKGRFWQVACVVWVAVGVNLSRTRDRKGSK